MTLSELNNCNIVLRIFYCPLILKISFIIVADIILIYFILFFRENKVDISRELCAKQTIDSHEIATLTISGK